jgi:hypothetical protein
MDMDRMDDPEGGDHQDGKERSQLTEAISVELTEASHGENEPHRLSHKMQKASTRIPSITIRQI